MSGVNVLYYTLFVLHLLSYIELEHVGSQCVILYTICPAPVVIHRITTCRESMCYTVHYLSCNCCHTYKYNMSGVNYINCTLFVLHLLFYIELQHVGSQLYQLYTICPAPVVMHRITTCRESMCYTIHYLSWTCCHTSVSYTHLRAHETDSYL